MTESRKKKKKFLQSTSGLKESLDSYLKLMDQEGLDELELDDGTSKVKLVRQDQYRTTRNDDVSPSSPRDSSTESSSSIPIKGDLVKSPLAGIFYRSASPKSPPFVKQGDGVQQGQVLCIIEAMKVMNEITAPSHGRVTKIFIENGQSVNANQDLFIIEPN